MKLFLYLSLYLGDEEPGSPKKEKKHRDGSKKKKKDKDKEERKKKKHKDRHGLNTEMASELVSPFRIKVNDEIFL